MEKLVFNRVVIDDIRTHRGGGEHLRNSRAALAWLEENRNARIEELWLDHDLGWGDTIRPVVLWLEEKCVNDEALDIGVIYVHTGSSVGAKWMMSSNVLNDHYRLVRQFMAEDW